MKHNIISLWIIILIASAFLGGCSGQNESMTQGMAVSSEAASAATPTGELIKRDSGGQDSIKIGAILMLTGIGASQGIASLRSAKMAIEEINKAGGLLGKPVELVVEDNQGDNPATAVSALQSLMARGISIVLGPNWSPSGNAVAPVACDNKVMMISPSLGIADFNEKCDYIFNLWPHDDALSRLLSRKVYDLGFRRIAVLGSEQMWEKIQSEAVKQGFEDAGGQVVSYQIAPQGDRDFRTLALKIKSSQPDAVVLTAFTFEDSAGKDLRTQGVDVPFFSVLVDDDRLRAAQGVLEDTKVITSFTPSPKFSDAYAKKYGEKLDMSGDTSYDTIQLIASAIKATGSTDPTILKTYLGTIKEYDGVSGHMVFDGKGGVSKQPQMMVVKGTSLVPLQDAIKK